MDIVDHAKNLGTILATAATISYISGYLVLRARANALGTDPAFTLVDQAYVFAGFRFVFMTLIVVLCLSPVFIIIDFLAPWLHEKLPCNWLKYCRWLLLVFLAAAALISLKIFTISGLLLFKDASHSNPKLMGAVMGTQPSYGLALTFLMTFLVMVSTYWLYLRLTEDFDLLTKILCAVVAFLVFMLPIYHGALFADRKVSVLVGVPSVVKNMVEPIGIVDHTKEHKTLFGNDANGNPSLTNVKHEDLYGYAIQEVIHLKQFAERLGRARFALESNPNVQVNRGTHMTSNTSAVDVNAEKSFFRTLIEHLQMAFESIGSLGDSVVQAGQLWSARIDLKGQVSKPEQLGNFSDLAWPVLSHDGATIYAVQKGSVVKLNDGFKGTEVINSEAIWIKLLGTARDGAILGLVYQESQAISAILDRTGKLQVLHSTETHEDRSKIANLMQESRAYSEDRALFVDRSERGGRGFDVFYKNGGRVLNISDCGDDSCGQASISPDFRRILFVRQPLF